MSRHIEEETLVLYHFGEDVDREAVAAHLEGCERCRRELDQIRRVLDAVDSVEVPERAPSYPRDVWARLEPQLATPRRSRLASWFTIPRLSWAGAMAAALVVAFFLGRGTTEGPAPGPVPVEVRERILFVAVGDHLEQSGRLLVELTNASGSARPGIDLTEQQSRAESLLEKNRLYRQVAAGENDAVDRLLEDLERQLLEIVMGPPQMTAAQLTALQRRIESRGLLFRVRVLGERTRTGGHVPDPRTQS